jgi:YbbR domain-containing protein
VTSVRSTTLRLVTAVLLSFALWVFVSYTQNPDQRSQYENIPVEIDGLEPGMLVVNEEGAPRTSRPQVNVLVDADAETLQGLRASDLRAFVDVSGREAGEHSVPVNVVTTRSGLARVRPIAQPEFLVLRLEQEITRTVPLSIELTGSVPFGFEAGDPRVTIRGETLTSVSIRGPQGRVERVANAQISADIAGLAANYNSPRPIEAEDADGQAVAGVTIEPSTANLLVPISSSVGIKRVPVVPQIAGQPASGFVVAGISVEPRLVTLTGSSGPLDELSDISTFDVDVTGATQTFSRTVPLEEPLNVRLGFNEPRTALVTVVIEPIARPFQVTLPVSVQVVDIPPGVLVSLSPQVVQVSFTGSAAALNRLSEETLVATVSLRDRGPGVYELTPVLTLPNGIALADLPAAVTVTVRLPPTPTETPPDETPTPTEAPPDETPTPTEAPPPGTGP